MTAPPLGGEQALHLLATMWRIRLFEERVGQLKRADEVHGLVHLSVGQEGVAAGVCTQLRADAGRDPFLADAEMDEPVHLVRALQLPDPLLEQADAPHRREQVQRLFAAERRRGHYAVTGAVPTTRCTAATILSSFGSTHASSGSL